MEERDGVVDSSGGVTVVGSDAPSEYHLAPRTENPVLAPESSAAAPPPRIGDGALPGMPFKKKRGRPRKYGPDGSAVLSPRPVSSSVPPPVIDFSALLPKRGKLKGVGLGSKLRLETKGLGGGDWAACSVGANFTPHIITVNAGEDVTMKVISFSQQGPRAICILSANGVVSSVTLRQPDSSGGTLTYEGRFEILSLCGSFMPSESGGTRSRSGGMSVSLASPDGRVVGGGVGGLLVAASPVQVVVGSFLAGDQHEHKTKKPKSDYPSAAALPGIVPSSEPTISFAASPAYRADSWSAIPSDSRRGGTEDDLSPRAIKEQKYAARRAILPVLQAEEDEGFVTERKKYLEHEAEVMKDATGWKVGESVYHSGRWVPPATGEIRPHV